MFHALMFSPEALSGACLDSCSSVFLIIKMLTIKNQMAGGKLAMIAGPHPPAL
jgi:hypothetical protein